MDKPTDLAPWADDANYPAGAEPEAGTPTKVAYTLGQEAVGWRPKGKPPAQELNTWMHRVGQWVQYVNDGEINGPWGWTGVITPAALAAGGNNNWNPTDLDTANVIRATPDAGTSITGLAGGVAGRVITIVNLGPQDISFAHDSTSDPEKRFLFANGVGPTINVDGTVTFWYDGDSDRWRLLAKT